MIKILNQTKMKTKYQKFKLMIKKSKIEIDDNINLEKKPFYDSIELPKKRKAKTFSLIEAIYQDNKKKSKK